MFKNAIYEVDKITDFRDMLYKTVNKFPKFPAFMIKGDQGYYYEITYEEFKNDVEALATELISKKINREQIVVTGKNSYQWGTTYFAIACSGNVIVPVDDKLPAEDLINIITRSEARLVFVDFETYLKLKPYAKSILKKITFAILDEPKDTDGYFSYHSMVARGKNKIRDNSQDYQTYLNIKIDKDALGVLLFTSGTTDTPKGVMLSQYNICFDIMSTNSVVKAYPEDRFLVVLPLHHTYECTLGFLLPIYNGACISFCDSIFNMMKAMKEFEPTVFITVPLMLEKIHSRILKTVSKKTGGKFGFKLGKAITNVGNVFGISLKDKIFGEIIKIFGGKIRLIICGAAAINPQVIEDFKTFGMAVYTGYGMTECSPLIAGVNDDLFNKIETYDTVGHPIPGVEIKLINQDKEGIGEICVKGDNVMLGYFNDEEATKAVFDKFGYFMTGDLGQLTEDGYYKIVGRIKNVIVTKNGKNIYPEEVEFYLNKNPFVAEAMVFGEDNENDTVVGASIYPDFDAIKEKFKSGDLTKDDIAQALNGVIKEVNRYLPSYKNIKKIKVRDSEFVKTTTAKIKRNVNIEENNNSDKNKKDLGK